MAKANTYKFQTEAREVLDLMIHSVYSNKDIFLRELISNASDALDKLRFEALSDKELAPFTKEPMIRISVDGEERTITVADNGVGMNRDELRKFIGVIAKSGTKEYVKLLDEAKKAELPPELIGQFGVGFYSSFMVASKVSLLTRRAGEEEAWLWESTGDGTYSIAEAQRDEPGTTVVVGLTEADPDSGLKDYADEHVVREIVKKYSDFVAHPIVMAVARTEYERDDEGKVKEDGDHMQVVEDETLNSMKAIWTRPESEVTDQEYNEFYKHISRDWQDPMKRVISKAEGATEFRTLLYLPAKAPYDLFVHDAPHGVHLYIKRVFIMNDCKELLPPYLRFVKGIVDSEDLPLNISREILQQDRVVKTIRNHMVKKTLGTLKEMREKEAEQFETFWTEFGRVVKEGIFHDSKNRDALLELGLFDSTADDSKRTTLDAYVERMKEGQETIYHMTGKSRSAIESSPHLEAFRKKGYEVLLLSDPVDEVWVQSVFEYKDKSFQSVGKGTVDLGSEEEKKEADEELQKEQEEFSDLLALLQKKLDENVKEVRLSTRLTESPACLVGEAHDLSPQLEQMLRSAGQEVPVVKRILELNPAHAILKKLQEIFSLNQEDPRLARYAHVLHGQALLAEGNTPPDPAAFSKHLVELMLETT
jgi:molecular chaperone HtpG